MHSYAEKRKFMRMATECPIAFKPVADMDYLLGQCKNLSAEGILFTTPRELSQGAMLDINITPQKMVVPPLNALVEVIRVEGGDAGEPFKVAGIIKQMR